MLRDFSIDTPRKQRALGMMIALASKLQEGNLIIFDKLSCSSPKTKILAALLKQHNLDMFRTLFVDETVETAFELSCQNIPNATVISQVQVNVLDLVKLDKVALTVRSFELLQQRLMEQYTHLGRRKAYLNSLKEMRAAVASV